jgi:OFA family oxalate/formate antiporter-like MFS transporter
VGDECLRRLADDFDFGLLQGGVVFLLSWWLSRPPVEQKDGSRWPQADVARHDYTPMQMVGTPVFWVMYLMFVMMAAGGLMATAQLAPIAKDFKIADVPVSLLGLTLPALAS